MEAEHEYNNRYVRLAVQNDLNDKLKKDIQIKQSSTTGNVQNTQESVLYSSGEMSQGIIYLFVLLYLSLVARIAGIFGTRSWRRWNLGCNLFMDF